jgi:hypothetical protein
MILAFLSSLLFLSCGDGKEEKDVKNPKSVDSSEENSSENTAAMPPAKELDPICKNNAFVFETPETTHTLTECQFDKLQELVEKGGIIQVQCQESITFPETLTITKNTWIEGPEEFVEFNGNQAVRLFFVNNNITFKAKNLIFKAGKTQGTEKDQMRGGAIFSGWKSRLWVDRCRFEQNQALGVLTTPDVGGGAIYTRSGGQHRIENSVFDGNESIAGGAVYTLLSNLTLWNNVFVNNKALVSTIGFGGGAVQTDGSLSVEANGSDIGTTEDKIIACDNSFEKNSSNQDGGAAFFYTWGQNQVLLYDNAFIENSSESTGGALRISGKTIEVVRNSFFKNKSKSYGGALNILKTLNKPSDQSETPGASTKIISSFFALNESEKDGGAIAAYGAKNIHIKFSSFIQNRATDYGGAAAGSYTETGFIMENNLFSENISDKNHAHHCQGEPLGQGNNLILNPGKLNDKECRNIQQSHELQWQPKQTGLHKYLSADWPNQKECEQNNLLREDSQSCYGAL